MLYIHREVAEKYAVVVNQQSDEITLLKASVTEANMTKAKLNKAQEKILGLEQELERRTIVEEQCVSMLKVRKRRNKGWVYDVRS